MKRRSFHHLNITRKLFRLGLEVEIRIVARNLTEAEAFDEEIRRISFWKNGGTRLANLTEGGDGSSGYRHTKHGLLLMRKTEAQKEALRLRHTGKKISESTREKIRIARTGTKLKDATKAKLSAAFKGRSFTPEWRAKISAGLQGRTVSDETRKLWSRQRKGKNRSPRSPETRAKISASVKAQWATRRAGVAS